MVWVNLLTGYHVGSKKCEDIIMKISMASTSAYNQNEIHIHLTTEVGETIKVGDIIDIPMIDYSFEKREIMTFVPRIKKGKVHTKIENGESGEAIIHNIDSAWIKTQHNIYIDADITGTVTSLRGNMCCEDENNWLLVEDNGYLQLYKCRKCGEEIWVHGDFPVTSDNLPQICKLYVEWSKEISLVSQINALKKIIPSVRKFTNSELLNIARASGKWIVDEMYVSEAEYLVKLAREQNLILSIETGKIPDFVT